VNQSERQYLWQFLQLIEQTVLHRLHKQLGKDDQLVFIDLL